MTILNKETIERANDNSFFDSGNALERDASAACEGFRANFSKLEKKLGGFNDAQKLLLEQREAGYRELVAEQYRELAGFHASNVPWYVAGPANYNGAMYNRKFNAAMKRFDDKDGKRERYIKNTEDMLLHSMSQDEQIEYWRNGRNSYGETIASDDPYAVEKMEAHLEYLRKEHDMHKQANLYIRKNGTANGCPLLTEREVASVNECLGRMPFKKHKFFFTDQESANIRNKEKRLEQLRSKRQLAVQQKESGESPELRRDGVRMVVNHEACRVQLEFDKKPSDDVIAKLKHNGFRWSPKNKVWQRQDTENGIRVARRMVEEFAA